MKSVRQTFHENKKIFITIIIVFCTLLFLLLVDKTIPRGNRTGLGDKTLWDWMQLLIVPIVITIISISLQRSQSRLERKLALWTNRNDDYQTYINNITDLILNRGLCSAKKQDKVRAIARLQTRAVLPRIEGTQKGHLLRFLKEAGLIEKNDPIISLYGAELDWVKLFKCDLPEGTLSNISLAGAHLFKANFEGLDLRSIDFTGADLHSANLKGALISEKQLNSVRSLKHATMPDGKWSGQGIVPVRNRNKPKNDIEMRVRPKTHKT